MPFPFAELCTLLARLEDIETHDPPLLASEKASRHRNTVESWFKSHRRSIDALDARGAEALLSSLLPEFRTDRVYGIQTKTLCPVLCRCLHLSVSRSRDLQNFSKPGRGDLGICLERVLHFGGSRGSPFVTVDEVDRMLHDLASLGHFSDPSIYQAQPRPASDRYLSLSNILRRVTPQEGKWLVRLILKDFAPVRMNEQIIFHNFHFLLPDLLRFQRSFRAASILLKTDMREFPENADSRSHKLLRQSATKHLRPLVGTKVGRPTFWKARGIDHCLKLLGSRRWILERKYDGEYCEVHINMTKNHRVQIFSKSGKDSTMDRKGLHQILTDCLRLDQPACKIQSQAILLGEMVAYSDSQDCILPFEHVRKHVTRSGCKPGTVGDARPESGEHLAIVFFDLLLLNEDLVMNQPLHQRRALLRTVYKGMHGRAMGAEWKCLENTDATLTRKMVTKHFAAMNARNCEGLVFKPYDAPYFSLEEESHYFIKLKKDYIPGMGDEEDFIVFGASFVAQRAVAVDAAVSRWTDFHLGCLLNADEVRQFNARPVIKHVATIGNRSCIPAPILHAANTKGNFSAKPFSASEAFDLRFYKEVMIDVVFESPLIFEVLGSGYEKSSDRNFLMLRHPRVTKMHEDRSWKDCISFQDLQTQAAAASECPIDSETQETRRWVNRLEESCRKKFECKDSVSPPSKRSSFRKRPRLRTGSVSSTSSEPDLTPQSPPPSKKPRHDAAMLDLTKNSESITSFPTSDSLLGRTQQGRDSLNASSIAAENCKPTTAARVLMNDSQIHQSPLSDITSCITNSLSKINDPSSITTVSVPKQKALSYVLSALQTLPDKLTPICNNTRCIFSNAAIYLAPCIASMPYITDDLLGHQHGLTSSIVRSLKHWERDINPSLQSCSPSVPESQAYPSLRKLVLVESRRKAALRLVLHGLAHLRENVIVCDWRALEKCRGKGLEIAKAQPWILGQVHAGVGTMVE